MQLLLLVCVVQFPATHGPEPSHRLYKTPSRSSLIFFGQDFFNTWLGVNEHMILTLS
jgi:hypothetical protein